MKGVQTAIALSTVGLTGLMGAAMGTGWFLNAVLSQNQDQTESRTTP